MVGENLNGHTGEGVHYFTLHDFLAIGFRRRRLIVTTFLGIFAVGVLVALLMPTQYESQMKILVRRERADSVIWSCRNWVKRSTGMLPSRLQLANDHADPRMRMY